MLSFGKAEEHVSWSDRTSGKMNEERYLGERWIWASRSAIVRLARKHNSMSIELCPKKIRILSQ